MNKALLFLLFPFSSIFAHQSQGENTIPAIMQIASKQAESIHHFDGKRLYLNTEKIYSTNYGPALCDDYSVILLPNLSTDSTGHYILSRSRDDYYFTCPKPNCGTRWWFSDTWSHLCPTCGTPGD